MYQRLQDKPLLLFLLLTAVSLLLRLFLASQDLSFLDQIFILDDSYYTLSIARSMAKGLGPTVDGLVLTNGFQPLITLFQLPIFLLGFNGDSAVVFAIALSAFWGALSTLIIGLILLHLSGLRAALLGCLLWMVCPIILKNDLNALETSLSGFLNLLTLLTVIIIDKKNSADQTFYLLIGLGLLCGLSLLARIDNCFLLAIIGMFALTRWGFFKTAIVVLTAFVVVLPWWLYSMLRFGTVIPQSGHAVRLIVQYFDNTSPFNLVSSLYSLVKWLPFAADSVWGVVPGLYVTFFVLAKGGRQAGIYKILFHFPAILLFFFYVFYLPAFWYLSRYYYFIYSLIILDVAMLLALPKEPWTKLFSYCFLSFLLLGYGYSIMQLLQQTKQVVKPGMGNPNGYREVVLGVKPFLLPGDVIGSMQSGAMRYFLPASIKVLNLDGVVNPYSLEANRTNTLKQYVDDQHMLYFYDWKINRNILKARYGAEFNESCFKLIYRAKKQLNHQFSLYRYQSQCP